MFALALPFPPLAPVLPPLAQLALFVGSALVFVAYLLWVLRHPFGAAPER